MNKAKANTTKTKTRRIDATPALAATANPFGQTWTFSEIADLCGVTEESVRVIEKRALRKIRTCASGMLSELAA